MIKYLEHTLVTLQWLSADGASSVHRSDFLGKGNVAEEPSERERMVKWTLFSTYLIRPSHLTPKCLNATKLNGTDSTRRWTSLWLKQWFKHAAGRAKPFTHLKATCNPATNNSNTARFYSHATISAESPSYQGDSASARLGGLQDGGQTVSTSSKTAGGSIRLV